MRRPWIALLVVAAVCFAAAPSPAPVVTDAERAAGESGEPPPRAGALPSAEEFAALAKTDPVALLDACLRRYRAQVHGYTATLVKRERVSGELHDEEVLKVAVREEPYAALMRWEKGARTAKLGGIGVGKIEGVLYAAGENGNQMVVWRPGALFAKTTKVDPTGERARESSRFAITEAGLGHALRRTYRSWSEAQEQGHLKWKYLGTREVKEVGGRLCHIVERTCEPHLDPFLMNEKPPDAAAHPADTFTSVKLMIDAERWLQVGSELRRADGELVGSYYFQDVKLNPQFPPVEFKPSAFTK
jgi:hypothetical protein